MDVQVILTGDDPKLGRRGQVVKVSAGYAQNYLFPNRKAQPATPAALKQFEAEKAKSSKEQGERLAQAQALAEKLGSMTVKLQMPAGGQDKLFGSVTSQHVVDALSSRGIHCERRMVHLGEPIKTLGIHEVEFRLHAQVTAKLKLEVVKKP